jgi:hypothetical protein
MTKLVVVLAVVVIVILVIVIIAARSMRAEDPDEFADRRPSRGGRDNRDDGYERQDRHPARSGRSARPPQRQGAGTGRMAAAGSGRGFDDRRDQQRSRRYDDGMEDDRGYEDDRGFERGAARGHGERRSPQPGPQERARGTARRGDGRPPRRPEESPEPARARPARRPSGDSSEWDSSEWEQLSDVDYWAELSANKPLTTTAQPAAQAAGPGLDRDADVPTRRTPLPPAPLRQDPETGLPVRGGRPQPAAADLPAAAAGRAGFTPAPVAVNGLGDQTRPVPAPFAEPRSSHYTDPSSLPTLPGQGRAQPPARPRVDPDDDPLTSPSFPRIPAADSRSYRNGRADTPPRGSSVPEPYLAQTQQFSSYGPSAPDYPGNGSFPGNGSRDTDATPPNGYDPLTSRDPYPAQASPPPARPAAPPAPVAPAASGNPYGSYVTPDSQATVSGYREYSGAHSRRADDDPGAYLPPALPSETPQPSANGYWPSQPPAAGAIPGSGNPGYPDDRGQYPDPLGAASQRPGNGNGYGNGYAAHDPAGYPAGYPQGGYPAGPHDPAAGHAPLDPYSRDGYGYPGYGPTGR